VLIGIVSGVVCYYAVALKNRLQWDDALDVWGVHGVGGALGTILTGVFASAVINKVSGLAEGNGHQFLVQVAGVAIAAIYAFVVTYGILRLINQFEPVRVSKETELAGLDKILHGEAAYGDM